MRHLIQPTTETIRESFPAMDVVTRSPNRDGLVQVTTEDTVAFAMPSARYGHQWRAFSPGSVVRYAQEYNECPIAAIDRARSLGHSLHWFNPCSVMITADKRERETWIGLEFGQRVAFEGRVFRIEPLRGNRDHVMMIDETEMHAAELKAAYEADQGEQA